MSGKGTVNFYWVMAGICALAIVVALVVNPRTANRLAESTEWPTTEGSITASKRVVAGRFRWRPSIVYEYTVGGVEYKRECQPYSVPEGTKEDIDAYVARNPVGKSVTVWYDPDHPRFSVLEPGVPEGFRRKQIGGMIVVGVFGLVMLFNAWTKSAQRASTSKVQFLPEPVTCACGKTMKVPASFQGKMAKCPGCGKAFVVPAAPTSGESGATKP